MMHTLRCHTAEHTCQPPAFHTVSFRQNLHVIFALTPMIFHNVILARWMRLSVGPLQSEVSQRSRSSITQFQNSCTWTHISCTRTRAVDKCSTPTSPHPCLSCCVIVTLTWFISRVVTPVLVDRCRRLAFRQLRASRPVKKKPRCSNWHPPGLTSTDKAPSTMRKMNGRRAGGNENADVNDRCAVLFLWSSDAIFQRHPYLLRIYRPPPSRLRY